MVLRMLKVLRVLRVLRVLMVLIVLAVLRVPVAAQPTPPEALEGLDPVLLTQGKEVDGKDALSVVHGRFKYFFSTAETKTAFEKDPSRYAVQLEGTCARMGPGVGGDPNIYSVHDGHIYMFGSTNCKDLFDAAPAKYLEPAPAALAVTAAQSAAARAVLDKAAAAMGALDTMTTFEERASQSRPPQGDMPGQTIKTALIWGAPDRVRLEMTFGQYGTFANVITRLDAFTVGPSGARPLPLIQAREYKRQALRHPVVLLRARVSEDFEAASRTAGVVDVQISGGPIMTVKIDSASGRPASLSYRGRGPGGEFGDVVITFTDYRTVDGVNLPFKRSVTFNGAPVRGHAVTVEFVEINKPLDAVRFQRPTPQ